MHRTEALGVAYDYVRLFTGVVTHSGGGRRNRPPAQPVFDMPAARCWMSAAGILPASTVFRRATVASRRSRGPRRRWFTLAGGGEPTVDGFVARVVEDRDFRRRVNDDLQDRAVHGEGPWKIQDAESVDIRIS